jgi:hypothetical protein
MRFVRNLLGFGWYPESAVTFLRSANFTDFARSVAMKAVGATGLTGATGSAGFAIGDFPRSKFVTWTRRPDDLKKEDRSEPDWSSASLSSSDI